MDKVQDWLSGKKTYIAAGLLIVVCGAELAGIDTVPGITKENALATAWEALVSIFIRAGIAKS